MTTSALIEIRRLARLGYRELATLVVLGLASFIAGVGWHWTTRPMGDSPSYRSAAVAIFGGWHHLTDRTPGYPFLLWLTGSTQGETHLLFVAQLVMHMVSVFLVVRVAARLGIPTVGRTAIAVLLVMPPEMVLVVSSGSEVLSQFLIAVALWSYVRWYDSRSSTALVAAGVALGLVGWVTPALAFLVVPVGVVVGFVLRRRGRPIASIVLLVAPALVIVGALFALNTVRFDAHELTPLTGWYLGSRTSLYVQRLPASYEPARSILVKERNRQLLEGDQVDAPNYSFAVRGLLARRLHMSSRQMDQYMLDLNLHLIVAHPLDYLTAVSQAGARYVDVDSEPGVLVAGQASGWAMEVIHLVLATLFALIAAVVVGLAWLGQLRGRIAAVWAFGLGLGLYGLVTATALETGTVRLRVPFDPILVLLLVSGAYAAGAARRRAVPTAA